MADLLSCPFCGGSAITHFFGANQARTSCLDTGCGASTIASNKARTVEQWNRRHSPPLPARDDSEAVRLLREAVGDIHDWLKVYRDWLAAHDSRASAPARPVVLPELCFDDAMHFGAISTKRLNELRIEAVRADREGR